MIQHPLNVISRTILTKSYKKMIFIENSLKQSTAISSDKLIIMKSGKHVGNQGSNLNIINK